MTEQPGSGTAGVALSGQDLLLATKLHVPRPQPGFVPRPRLTGRLDEGLARGFVLVCAPAGYGKTALLADRPGPAGSQWPGCRWMQPTATRRDSGGTWRQRWTGCDQESASWPARCRALPAPRSFEGLVTALIDELARQPDEDQVLLILDDYHLMDSQSGARVAEVVLEHLPPGLGLGLASRSEPRWRWRPYGSAGSSLSCAPPSYGSRRRRRSSCSMG